jgi:hypothetical protein
MEKIKSLFQRNYDGNRQVRNEVVPGSEWVINGEGVATEKIDGTCCMVKDGELYKRYDAKQGKTPPEGFIPAQEPDEVTGHWPGWLLVGDGPEDKWHRQAFNHGHQDGTYELIGPKIQGNKYKYDAHNLEPHGAKVIDAPRDFESLKDFFRVIEIEGIVWHHPDGRMVKIKRKDFGFKW